MSIPDNLRGTPALFTGPPPDPRAAGYLPFDTLAPGEFEKFCLNFILASCHDVMDCRLHGIPGQWQGGYDLWATRVVDGRQVKVFAECKRRRCLRPRDLRRLFAKFATEQADRIAADNVEFWLFTSGELSRHDNVLQESTEEYAGKFGIRVFDSSSICAALLREPHAYGPIVQAFFNFAWAQRFYGRNWWELAREWSATHDSFSRVLSGVGLARLLRKLYPHRRLMEFCGATFPVTVLEEASRDQRTTLESARGGLDPSPPPASDEYPHEFNDDGLRVFRERREEERVRPDEVWNGMTYAVSRIAEDEAGLKIHCRMGRYFLALATCDALGYEIVDALAAEPDVGITVEQLPMRRWLHEHVTDPTIDGSLRSPAVALSTLVVYRSGKGRYRMMICERSQAVAVHPFRYHVPPSGMLQPVFDFGDPQAEYTVRHNFFREFLEEVYSYPEVRSGQGQTRHDFFYGLRPLVRLREMLACNDQPPKAELVYTGTVLDLMSLRPEICTLLLIRDAEWYDEESVSSRDWNPLDFIHFNNEFLRQKDDSSVSGRVRLKRRFLFSMGLDDDLNPVEPGLLSPGNMVPTGAGAIYLGLRAARDMLGAG